MMARSPRRSSVSGCPALSPDALRVDAAAVRSAGHTRRRPRVGVRHDGFQAVVPPAGRRLARAVDLRPGTGRPGRRAFGPAAHCSSRAFSVGNSASEHSSTASPSSPPASTCSSRRGRSTKESPRPSTPSPVSIDEATTRAAALLRSFLERYMDEHPNPTLQLTGGQDSRLVLSAIPRARRKGLRVMTMGVPGTADVDIAASLAARYGMEHTVHGLDGLAGLSPAESFDSSVRCCRSARLHGRPDRQGRHAVGGGALRAGSAAVRARRRDRPRLLLHRRDTRHAGDALQD